MLMCVDDRTPPPTPPPCKRSKFNYDIKLAEFTNAIQEAEEAAKYFEGLDVDEIELANDALTVEGSSHTDPLNVKVLIAFNMPPTPSPSISGSAPSDHSLPLSSPIPYVENRPGPMEVKVNDMLKPENWRKPWTRRGVPVSKELKCLESKDSCARAKQRWEDWSQCLDNLNHENERLRKEIDARKLAKMQSLKEKMQKIDSLRAVLRKRAGLMKEVQGRVEGYIRQRHSLEGAAYFTS